MRPRGTRRAVAALDVADTPVDLGDRVGAPVGTGRSHLRTGQGLRDTVGARRRVLGVGVPLRLTVPQEDQALVFAVAPALGCDERLGQRTRIFARVGRRHSTRRGGSSRSSGGRSGIRVLRVGSDRGDLFLRGDRAELRTIAHGGGAVRLGLLLKGGLGINARGNERGRGRFLRSFAAHLGDGLRGGMLGDRHGGQDLVAVLFLPHGPRRRTIDAGSGHLGLAHEQVGAGRRRLAEGDFNGFGGFAAGHATHVDREFASGAVGDGDAVQGVHGDSGGLEDGARVLAGTCGDFAGRAVHRDRDVAGARDDRGQLIAGRGAVRRERDSRAERRSVGEDTVRRGGRGPQCARLPVDVHCVGLRGAHDDRVAVAHGLTRAGLHEVVAANAHAGGLERIADSVAPRGDGTGHAVHLKHDGGVRGGDADAGDAEDTRRGQGRDSENDARGGCKGAQPATEDVQGAGGGRTQGGAQMMAHNSPVTRYWYCWSA